MKKIHLYKIILPLLFVLTAGMLQAKETVKPRLVLDVAYHLTNNEIPSVTVLTRFKVEKKFSPAKGIAVKVFLNEAVETNLLGIVTTDKEGKGVIYFPPSIKPVWDSISEFTILAEIVSNKDEESISNEVTLTKAKITIDTTIEDSVKTVIVKVMEKKGAEWFPAAETETKIIVKRLAGNLSIGEEESYTTDTTGEVIAEFGREGIPGDRDGNLVLVAKTEDNELYGNISIEKKIKWGAVLKADDTFGERSLFATRDKAPFWLLGLAGGIVISVWTVIFYLVLTFFKIRSAGKSAS